MCGKDFIEKYRALQNQIRTNNCYVLGLREGAQIRRSITDGIKVQNTHKTHDDVLLNYFVKAEEIEKKNALLEVQIKEILETIEKVENDDLRLFLLEKHVNSLTIEQISEKYFISVRQLYRLLNKAYNEVEKMIS